MAYKGKFKPTNISKYLGDHTKIRFLSLWEKQLMGWLDTNIHVVQWSSEIPIKYVCGTDMKVHKYLVDFYIATSDGRRLLVEVKPYKQTIEPKEPKRRTRRSVNESYTWVKNNSKWDAARELCAINNMKFVIWTENELKMMGLKII